MFAHSNVTVRVGINKLRLERISKTPRSLRIPGSKPLVIIPRAAAARSAGREPTARLSVGVGGPQQDRRVLCLCTWYGYGSPTSGHTWNRSALERIIASARDEAEITHGAGLPADQAGQTRCKGAACDVRRACSISGVSSACASLSISLGGAKRSSTGAHTG